MHAFVQIVKHKKSLVNDASAVWFYVYHKEKRHNVSFYTVALPSAQGASEKFSQWSQKINKK